MSRLGRNIGASLLANAWATVLAIVLTPLYVRWLGIESYGLIGFYMSWVALLGILDTGISATALRQVAWLSGRPEERHQIGPLLRSLERAYWGIVLAVGAVLLGWAIWLGPTWFRATSVPAEGITQALVLMAVSLVVQVPSGLYAGGLMGFQRHVSAAVQTATFGTLRSAGALAVLVVVAPDIRVFFLWQIAASAAQTASLRLTLFRDLPRARTTAAVSPQLLRSVGAFAGGMSAVTALSLVLAQADKLVLSRVVPLETFGLYVLAWTVASALTRIASPLIQAFSPRFTELVSAAGPGLANSVHMACQVTNALVLPPAALLAVLPYPLLLTWTGDPALAAGAAPLLSVLAIGTALSACGYPALSVLYSTGHLRPVLVFNAVAVIVVLPLVVAAALRVGATGAALVWAMYGAMSYVTYQWLGMLAVGERPAQAILRNMAAPAAVSIAISLLAGWWVARLEQPLEVAAAMAVLLAAGWALAVAVSRDLSRRIAGALAWKPLATP